MGIIYKNIITFYNKIHKKGGSIMNLNKLQYFMSVYEEGSITAAAKKHFVSQVAMSQQIMSLEEELGIKLFIR